MIKVDKSADVEIEIVIAIILAIAALAVALSFSAGLLGKSKVKFEEQIAREPEPPNADSNTPITLSRENIISKTGNTEIIKVNIFNPTDKDWIFRDAVTLEDALCGISGDGICFVDLTNTKCNSKDKDRDCKEEYDCTQNSQLGEGIGCVIVKGNSSLFCPADKPECNCDVDTYDIGKDPDCSQTEGVRLNIECSQGLQLEKITNPKEAKAGSSTEFSALLKIDKKTKKGDYLCKIGVEGFLGSQLEKYAKDLTIRIG